MSRGTENRKKKVEFIVAIFKNYQPKLTISEQLALLEMWINACVDSQEFEMASALLKEKRFITNNLESVPRRIGGEPMSFEDEDNPLFSYREAFGEDKVVKKIGRLSIYRKIINRIKKFFKWRT